MGLSLTEKIWKKNNIRVYPHHRRDAENDKNTAPREGIA
jgi:hypothetical protein